MYFTVRDWADGRRYGAGYDTGKFMVNGEFGGKELYSWSFSVTIVQADSFTRFWSSSWPVGYHSRVVNAAASAFFVTLIMYLNDCPQM